ncbi:hypothetical protein AB0912_15665 [Streptomyces sp. NPDC007084]|uniref:hypothetical protein n=1 Tax=Streptomyces sp. NPDC007084 TaxID=3154313 RepID=UPI003452310E
MARMYTCGFELLSAAALMEWQDSNGSPAISQTIHRAGNASLRITPSGATQYIEHQLTSGVVQRTFHRFYLYITALPAADCNIYGIGQSGYFPGVLRLTSTGQLQLRDNQAAVNLGSPTGVLSTGRWYRVELDFTDVGGTLTAGVSAFKGYLDGVQFADTLCTNINGFSRFRVGAIQSATAMDVCIDDIAVNDDTGTVQNGLPGPGSVVHLQPAGAGDNNTWTGVGGTAGAANNWTRVAEAPPDDATTYNQTAATGTTATDDFTVSSPASAGIGASDAITLVAVGARIGSTATTTASIVTRIKGQSGGTVSESPSTSVAVNGWSTHKSAVPRLYQLTTYSNPQTADAWTPATLAAAQIGYRASISQSTTRRVSTLWALVEFVPNQTTSINLGATTSLTAAAVRSTALARATTAATSVDGLRRAQLPRAAASTATPLVRRAAALPRGAGVTAEASARRSVTLAALTVVALVQGGLRRSVARVLQAAVATLATGRRSSVLAALLAAVGTAPGSSRLLTLPYASTVTGQAATGRAGRIRRGATATATTALALGRLVAVAVQAAITTASSLLRRVGLDRQTPVISAPTASRRASLLRAAPATTTGAAARVVQMARSAAVQALLGQGRRTSLARPAYVTTGPGGPLRQTGLAAATTATTSSRTSRVISLARTAVVTAGSAARRAASVTRTVTTICGTGFWRAATLTALRTTTVLSTGMSRGASYTRMLAAEVQTTAASVISQIAHGVMLAADIATIAVTRRGAQLYAATTILGSSALRRTAGLRAVASSLAGATASRLTALTARATPVVNPTAARRTDVARTAEAGGQAAVGRTVLMGRQASATPAGRTARTAGLHAAARVVTISVLTRAATLTRAAVALATGQGLRTLQQLLHTETLTEPAATARAAARLALATAVDTTGRAARAIGFHRRATTGLTGRCRRTARASYRAVVLQAGAVQTGRYFEVVLQAGAVITAVATAVRSNLRRLVLQVTGPTSRWRVRDGLRRWQARRGDGRWHVDD